MLDVMQMDYISEITHQFPFKYNTISFAISIPQICLNFIQDILLSDDLTNINDEHPGIQTKYDLSDAILCATAEIILDQILLTGLVKFEDKNYNNNSNNDNNGNGNGNGSGSGSNCNNAKKKPRKFKKQSLEIIESRVNLDFDSLRLNVVIFVAEHNFFQIFRIPDSMHHFKDQS